MRIMVTASGDFTSTYGGGQTYVQRLVAAMCRMDGVEVSVLSFVSGRNGNLAELIYEGRVAVYTADPGITPEQLSLVLRDLKPDVIHANGGILFHICCASRLAGVPCVVTAHGGGILCPGGALLNNRDAICCEKACYRKCLKCCLGNIRWGNLLYPLLRWIPRSIYVALGYLLKKLPFLYYITPVGTAALSIESKRRAWECICSDCTAIIAPSHTIRKAMEINGMNSDKIIVLPHGVPEPKMVPTFVSDSITKFFYVGRMNYVKGIHVLLEAFHGVKNEHIELHLIGGAGNKREQAYMENLQKKYAKDARITWHGKVAAEKVNDMIAGYHVLVHPAICMEIYGLSIAESLSMGKWVLATRCGGAEMQVIEDENGWLIPSNDSNVMRRKIEEISSDPPTTSPTVRNYHTVSEHANALVDIYRRIYLKERGSMRVII